MASVKFTVLCTAVYDSKLEIPDDIRDEDVLAYIREHLDNAVVGKMTWLADADPEEAVTEEDIREIIRD